MDAGELAQHAEVGGNPPAKKSRLSRTIPTDRLTFQKQCEILRAYPAAFEKVGGPVSIEDITEFVKMAPSTISQSNSFFTDIGVVQKEGRKFNPSAELIAMHRLYGIHQAKAWAKLAPLFERAWFGQILIPKLRYQPMTAEDMVHDLADAATAEPDHLGQLGLIIEYLLLVGLVHRDGGVVKLVNHAAAAAGEEKDKQKADGIPPGTNDALPTAKEEGLEPYPLVLDAKTKRRIVLYAPPSITAKELKRIQQWLQFQLIVEDDASGPGPAT